METCAILVDPSIDGSDGIGVEWQSNQNGLGAPPQEWVENVIDLEPGWQPGMSAPLHLRHVVAQPCSV